MFFKNIVDSIETEKQEGFPEIRYIPYTAWLRIFMFEF